MSFIGNAPAAIPTSFQSVEADSFNGTGSAVNFTLSRQITNLYDIEVLVDNVQQSPYDGSYSVSGTTLTFSAAPSSGTNNIYVIYRDHPITSIAPRAQTIEVVSPGGGTSSLVAASSASDYTLTLPAAAGTLDRLERAGNVLQVVNVTTTSVATTTTVIPEDDTIPQNTEGGEFMSLSITPTSASSKLFIQVVCNLSPGNSSGAVIAALFQDSTAGALAAVAQGFYDASDQAPLTFNHYMTAGTTSSTTFKVRGGKPSGANPVTFNGITSGRLFGGVYASSITIMEIAT